MRGFSFFYAGVFFICFLVLLPILQLFWIALTGSIDDWYHLSTVVLPHVLKNTFSLLILTGIFSVFIGVLSAWLITTFDFRLRRFLSWMIILPLAMPPYLVAYALSEFFHYAGPVQKAFRNLTGFQTIHDYWFPNIHSTEGAAVVFSSVLYPYIYLTTRAVLILQGQKISDAARTLGAKSSTIFFKILLPLSRPAIISGTVLVLMETLNDIGASEYLGVQTLTFSVYATWLNRGNLGGAAQISLIILFLVFFILSLENHSSQRQRFHVFQTTHLKTKIQRQKIYGYQVFLAVIFLSIPLVIGFCIPVFVFGLHALRRIEKGISDHLIDAFFNSLITASLTAFFTVLIALFLCHATRVFKAQPIQWAARISAMGYTLPGGILALGLLFMITQLDHCIDRIMVFLFDKSSGLLLTGSIFIVVLAYTLRFIAISESSIRSALTKLPPNLDSAARSLGRTSLQTSAFVLFPLLIPAVFSSAFLVFVDTVKELSATILLRPFDFNTLATYIYEHASRGAPEEGALAALLIIASSVLPIIFLSKALADDHDLLKTDDWNQER